jgi:hypothetical protein
LEKRRTAFSLEKMSYGNPKSALQLHDSQFGKLKCSELDLVIVATLDVDENAGAVATILRNPNRETIVLRFLGFDVLCAALAHMLDGAAAAKS